MIKAKIDKQLRDAKTRHGDAVRLFRYGDFYEAFQEDAVTMATVCKLTRTSRDGVDMTGFPFHSLEDRMRELLAAGHRVAICEVTP